MDKAQRRGQRQTVASRPGLGAFSWVRDMNSKRGTENPDEGQRRRRREGRQKRKRERFREREGRSEGGPTLDVLHGVACLQLSILKVKEARFAYGGTTLPLCTIAS